MQQFLTYSFEETMAVARRLAPYLHGGDVVAFTGGIGSGKTTFCRALVEALGSDDPVQSPTFSIVNTYRGNTLIAHFDAWRINTEEDLETAGFYDYITSGALVLVEWSENISAFLPKDCITIDIVIKDDCLRAITIKGVPTI